MDFPQSRCDSNNVGIDFVLSDLDMAMTFMDVAAASESSETVVRNHSNALKAHTTVVHVLKHLRPTAEQTKAIDHKLVVLKAALIEVGYVL